MYMENHGNIWRNIAKNGFGTDASGLFLCVFSTSNSEGLVVENPWPQLFGSNPLIAVDGCRKGSSATLRKLVAAGALAVPRDFPGDWPLTGRNPRDVASIESYEGPNFCNM